MTSHFPIGRLACTAGFSISGQVRLDSELGGKSRDSGGESASDPDPWNLGHGSEIDGCLPGSCLLTSQTVDEWSASAWVALFDSSRYIYFRCRSLQQLSLLPRSIVDHTCGACEMT